MTKQKIYNKIVYDKDMNIIEEDSFMYDGPVAQCKFICFAADTKVLMADDTEKNIQDIVVDDVVKSWNQKTKELEPARVIKLMRPLHDDIIEIEWEHGKTTNTFDHPFWDQENECWMSYKPTLTMDRYKFKEMMPMIVGSVGTFLKDNQPVKSKIISITEQRKEIQTYIFQLDKNNTFFANGHLTHNKGNPLEKIKDAIVGGIKKLVGKVVSIITSPFGVNVDIPDYDIGVDQTAAIEGALVTKDSAVANIPVIYGKRMVGTTRVYVESGSGGNEEYLYVAHVIGEGPINGVTKVMLDDNDVGITSGQLTHGSQFNVTSGKYSGRLTLQFFDGRNNKNGSGAQLHSDLLASSGNNTWGAEHRLEGVAYIAARYQWKEGTTPEEVKANPYLGNVPSMICEVEGKKIFDAKTLTASHSTAYDDETISYSTNPVSCLLDYMRNPVYGKGLTNDDFSYASWDTAAHLCEQTVSYPGTNYSDTDAFSTNYVLDTGTSLMSNTKILCAAFRGIMPYQGGKYHLVIEHGGDNTDVVATPSSPTTVMTVNNDHIIGGMSIDGENKLSKVNRVIITYVNPIEDYQPDQVAFPATDSAVDKQFMAEDNNTRLESRISVPFCTSKAQAEQYGVVFLKKSRTQKLISFQTNLATSNLGVGDLIRVQNEHLSLDGVFRVMDIKVSLAGTIEINAVEHQASHYGIGCTGNEVIKPVLNLPDPTTAQPVTNLTAVNKRI